MEKLNKVGLEVLEYKKELLRSDHSKIVRRALLSATTDLLSGDIINVDIHDALRDDELSARDVRSLILSARNLVKTSDELKEEYEALRVPFHERLMEMEELSDPSFARVTSESHVAKEEIQVILSFEMTKAFIGEYFAREDEHLDTMMRSEGFAEKFAILRYGALMIKFLEKQTGYNPAIKRALLMDGIELGATKVYVNKDEELYGVELVFHLDIEKMEDESLKEELLPLLARKIKEANEYVNIRTIA